MPELVTYIQLSARFPIPNEDSDKSWAKLLRRLIDDGKIKDGVHFKHSYAVSGHPCRVYNLRHVVKVICLEARKEPPKPLCAFLQETFYDDFCTILTPVTVITPGIAT